MALGPFMVDIVGVQLTEDERELLTHPLVGGVILFSRNYESRDQIEGLVAMIKRLRKPSLLVGVDHEGGRVQRFRQGFTPLPPVGHLGKIYDKDQKLAKQLAETTGWLMAIELLAVGIDFSFAPVLDLDRGISTVIGDRAFHSDPQVVSELASAYINGMRRAGMNACGKHFPGHGAVAADSHIALPIDTRPFEDIAAEDLAPFSRMIHFGLGAIMPAHVIYEKVDARPAGFSEFWIQEVLRTRLGFRGAVISDDLSMEAAASVGSFAERARLALDAGCDLALVCNNRGAALEAIAAMEGYKNTPVSQMRLARLHGRHFLKWSRLAIDSHWNQAVNSVVQYADLSKFNHIG